jgi:hypothetical protein
MASYWLLAVNMLVLLSLQVAWDILLGVTSLEMQSEIVFLITLRDKLFSATV